MKIAAMAGFGRIVLMTALAAVLGGSLAACERREGPAEELGEEIDEAVEDAKDAVD